MELVILCIIFATRNCEDRLRSAEKASFLCSHLHYHCRQIIIVMTKETSYIIEYLICCIGAFARKFKLTNAKAYQYLSSYKGLDFLIKCYEAEHTLSIEDAVDDITVICQRHGGALA